VDKGDKLMFWVHKQLAQTRFHKAKAIFTNQFDWIDWEMVHMALRRIPRIIDIALAYDVVRANVGQNVTPHNPSLGLFLYHFLHTMVS
jgi:hypothetical protein